MWQMWLSGFAPKFVRVPFPAVDVVGGHDQRHHRAAGPHRRQSDTPLREWTPGRPADDDVGMVLHAQPADKSTEEAESAISHTSPVPCASLRNPFPPIADYAFLSDCETTCLI